MPRLPEGFQLVFPGLQFELGACREDPCTNSCLRIIPVPSNHPILKSNPKSFILISGPLTSYSFYLSLGWPSSEFTSFSWESLLVLIFIPRVSAEFSSFLVSSINFLKEAYSWSALAREGFLCFSC